MIIRSDYRAEGISFFTPDDFSQQLGYMNRPKGYKIHPHIHPEVNIAVTNTQEVLFIKSGKVKLTLYTTGYQLLQECILLTGDVVLLASGGHSFEMLEDSEMIEVKQGPFNGVEKIMFQPK